MHERLFGQLRAGGGITFRLSSMWTDGSGINADDLLTSGVVKMVLASTIANDRK
ncbi:hypothetical protein [Streptomyces flavofungini]|uniref:hypothetical protein n=1 Tax=Streptomyces flavofungini TaxID=68200 RepID=UPI0034DE7FE2